MKKDGTLYHKKKSAFLDIITDGYVTTLPNVNALVVDLSCVIRSQATHLAPGKLFEDFVALILRNITSIAKYNSAQRIDIVADQYSDRSVKYHTRADRKSKGFGYQIEFNEKTIVPADLKKSFLLDESNKTKLNDMIANQCKRLSDFEWDKEYCVTNRLLNVQTKEGERTIYTPNMIEVLEEADNRIVCHINNLLENGHSQILVKTGDTDVIVILLGFLERFFNMMYELELYVDFGTAEGKKISLNACYSSLGSEVCSAFPFFHSFTGADSTSAFYKISKKVWFHSWMKFPSKEELTKSFQKLSCYPCKEDVLSSEDIIQKFVVYTYSKSIDSDLDELR